MDKDLSTSRAPSHRLGLDECLCLAMLAGYTSTFHDNAPLVSLSFVIVVLYLLAGMLPDPGWQWRAKFFLLAAAIGLFVFGLGAVAILERHFTAPYLFVHDGLIQTEEATKLLLQGKDPYGADYSHTPMGNWEFRLGRLTLNPALYHNAYLPFLFLFTAPFYGWVNGILGWFDARLLFLPLLIVVLLITGRWVKDRPSKYGLMFLISFNPFFTPYMIQGRNDIFVLCWIVLGVHLLRLGHERLSLIALALACASKLTAWFVLPFYFVFLLQPDLDELDEWLRKNALSAMRRMLPFVATVALIIVPFLLWQPRAFVDDVWSYPNGTSAFAPYPVAGYGFNGMAQGLGWIPAGAVTSPFEILQWVIGLPLLCLLVWRQLKNNSMANMWFSYALLIAVMSFFSHVLNDNHVGFILIIFAIAKFVDDDTRPVGWHGLHVQ